MAKHHNRKAKGRRGDKSTQATGFTSLQPTTDSIENTQVTSHGNSEWPSQSGSGDGNGNSDRWDSLQPENVSDTSETSAVPLEKDWNKENTSVNTEAGKHYPLPGTVVDFSGPRSDFSQQIKLLQNHKPARYESLLDLRNAVRKSLITKCCEAAADFPFT